MDASEFDVTHGAGGGRSARQLLDGAGGVEANTKAITAVPSQGCASLEEGAGPAKRGPLRGMAAGQTRPRVQPFWGIAKNSAGYLAGPCDGEETVKTPNWRH